MRISDWSSDVCSSDRAAGRGDYARQQRRLGQRELRNRRAEVGLGRGSDAVGALAEVDDRQVLEEDLVLVDLAVELGGEDRLAPLALDRLLAARDRVLHQPIGRASCRERVCQYV